MRDPVLREVLSLAGIFLAGSCLAQAPSEDRRLQLDAINAGQQRISALLRDLDSADARLKAAEVDHKRAEQEAKDAAVRLEEARKRNDGAARALKQAQQQSALARKAYESESEAFERLRRPQAPAKAAGQAPKPRPTEKR
jgi:hypothetical protein